jgi:hypothetical protein
MKHTPGPWRVNGRFVMALKEKTVCEVPQFGVIHGKVDAANIRLIAAAPELLEALKCCMCVLRTVSPGGDGDPDVEFARAAIAKAEGK